LTHIAANAHPTATIFWPYGQISRSHGAIRLGGVDRVRSARTFLRRVILDHPDFVEPDCFEHAHAESNDRSGPDTDVHRAGYAFRDHPVNADSDHAHRNTASHSNQQSITDANS